MDDITRGLRKVNPDDINPRHNWQRHLPALGTMGVDFEERVDYQRLHKYRIGRVRQALENSELGALITFDVNNIRRSANGSATSSRAGRCSRGPESRSCGTSARPPCITSSTRPGLRRRTARPG